MHEICITKPSKKFLTYWGSNWVTEKNYIGFLPTPRRLMCPFCQGLVHVTRHTLFQEHFLPYREYPSYTRNGQTSTSPVKYLLLALINYTWINSSLVLHYTAIKELQEIQWFMSNFPIPWKLLLHLEWTNLHLNFTPHFGITYKYHLH